MGQAGPPEAPRTAPRGFWVPPGHLLERISEPFPKNSDTVLLPCFGDFRNFLVVFCICLHCSALPVVSFFDVLH